MSAIFSVPGVKLGITLAKIKPSRTKDDLVLMELCEGATTAATFTTNAFCAAPVTLAKQHLAKMQPRYLLINAGNANAGTGDKGLQDAAVVCQELAGKLGVAAEAVLPFSTGVIGEYLPLERMVDAFDALIKDLDEDHWDKAANAIMTTDIVKKITSREIIVKGKRCVLTGIAKGSGMIHPNMATMLGYAASDAQIPADLLQTFLSQAVNKSFNRITVDGDTSTNDACTLSATGQSDFVVTSAASAEGQAFYAALESLMIELAQAIVRDGEGATKFMTIQVEKGLSEAECHQAANTIALSPLVKTAFFASDPNWGRIAAALGRAGLADLDIDPVEIYLGDVRIVKNGGRDPDYTEAQGAAVMQQKDILIRVVLNRGHAQATVWTCDFSYEYVKINAEYRT